MKMVIQQIYCVLAKRWLVALCILGCLLLESCNDANRIERLDISQRNVVQLSIPDAKSVQVRSVANEPECMINGLQAFVYNDTHTSSPVYYQEGKSGELSFLFGNGTASPIVTLKNYIPQNGDRVYMVCNLTNRTSVSGEGDFLIAKTVSEEQLRNYASQGLMKGFSSLKSEGRTIPMYGWIEWNEAATSNICLMTRCLAKITVDADAQSLFPDKVVYWEWRNLNYSDFTLDSGYKGGIYQGSINESGISEKHDLLSATTPVDATKGLVNSYYPLEYKHSINALGNEVDEKTFSKDRAMLLLTVQNPDGSDKEYYRLDFWDKETGKYLDIVRNHSYRFHITKLKSKGYSSVQEASLNPGSNIEYTITASDNWSQGFGSNGQYLVKVDRERIELLESDIRDPVTMVKIELQADDTDNVNLDDITTRKVRIVHSENTLIPPYFMSLYYSVDNQNLVEVKWEDGSSDNVVNLPQSSNVYWIYCKVPVSSISSIWDISLEITIGNIVKNIPISFIPHSKAIAIDDDGPANSFITPVTYGVYSFDATVIGNGAEGIVSETRGASWSGVLAEDIEKYHFKNAFGEDISVSKNVQITPKSAKLIWQDKENLISQVAFNSATNRVEFLSNGAGNGVIAVYDNPDPNAEGANVLWSWHVWCTEKPDLIELGLPTNGETYSGKDYKIMDRDLGATTTTEDELTTCGLGYQWGRKDPFIGVTSFYTSTDDPVPENAPMYDVRGVKQELKEEVKNENIGTIEYAIKHPNVFIRGGGDYSEYDWLYYTSMSDGDYFLTGNQYLWGNNPYSRNKMVNIKTMKTLYDPCPAGYMVPPPDIYGAFLKEKIINNTIVDVTGNILGHSGRMEDDCFYTPSYTKYGAYFYYGGENSKQKVYFIATGTRMGWTDDVLNYLPGYSGHLSGTLTAAKGDGANSTMSFYFFENIIRCSFGAESAVWEDRASAAAIRCVRDE
nr:hypothetical protein [Bacteroides ovatus]